MTPLATLAGLLAAVMLLLALSPPTAVLEVVAYGLFCGVVCAGAAVEAWQGRPTRARRWGFAHLVVSVLVVAALDLAGSARGATWGHWGVAFAFVLAVGWIPPVVAFGLAPFARARGASRIRKVVRERRRALAATSENPSRDA